MAKTRVSKNGKVTISGLTSGEYCILCDCVSRCKEAMQWDDEALEASDGERFFWSGMSIEELSVLQNLEI